MTTWNNKTSVTTSYNGRDPVGRKYLSTESGQIITTEDGKWIIAIDTADTNYTSKRLYTTVILGDIGGTLGGMIGTLSDYYTGTLPTNYNGRIIP